jgi:cytochrome c2
VRTMSSSLGLLLGGTLLATVIAVGCSTATGAAGAAAAGASRGERFFRTKCNACHPGGGQGAGPAIDLGMAPEFLERGKTSGRHAVPEADWEPLFAYMNTAFGGGAAVAAAVPGAAPVVAAVPTTMPAPPAVPTTMAAVGDAAAGGVYFQAKCQKCHPGGAKITGKAIPGVLVKGGSGKHGVDAASFDNLMAFLPSLGAVPQAAAPVMATPAPPATTTTTTTAVATAPAAGGGDTQAGAQYFDMKCKKCHPGGSKITGKAIPGVLVAGGSGKHGVEAAQFENLLSYLVTIGAVRAGGGPVAAGPSGTTMAPPPPPPPTTTTGSGTIPTNAGMVPCTCNCQCPPGAPPEALPAACICQCSCPR